jgi:hypothetical protein
VWRNKALWILGFLVALGGGGGGGGGGGNFSFPGSSGSGGGSGGTPGVPSLPRLTEQQIQAILAAVVALLCVFAILGIIFAIVGVIANGGLIAGADDADATGRMSFGAAFKRGSARFWSLLGMRIVLWLPTLIVGVVVGIIVLALFGASIASALNDRSDRNTAAALLASLGGLFCIAFPVGLLVFVYDIVARGIKVFGDRAIMLEGAGAMDGIRRGWAMFKSRLGDIFLTGLVLVVIGFVAGILFAIVAGAIMAPGVVLLLTQINSQIQTVTWVVLAVSVVLAIVLTSLLASVLIAFRATTWTLVYRAFVPRPAPAQVTPFTPVQA